MTTSYELSLKLKELGVEQHHGEYYWVNRNGHVISTRFLTIKDKTLCRAFTLGELVRMMKGCSVMQMHDGNWFAFIEMDAWGHTELEMDNKYTSPEEAAGELFAAIKEQEKQKA